MGDLNPSLPACVLASASMVKEWSHLLPDLERSAFVRACTEAGADNGRLQAVLSQYFSTWKTSLMADDLNRLQMLATSVQIRDFVKVIWLEDDFDFELASPLESSVIWPRHEDGQVVAEALGVGLLKSLLAARQLCPERLEIRDKRIPNAPSDPEIAGILARNILDGTDLAITELVLDKESAMTTMITIKLSPAHQGQGTGFSMLRKAVLCLSQSNSYWANQILLHAPALKELSLSFSFSFLKRGHTPHIPPFILDNPNLPALKKLELSLCTLPATDIMAILSKSKQSLTAISFRLSSLRDNSTWAELLRRIHTEFPHLTWFSLAFIGEGPIGRFRITFPGLDQDSVIGEPYKNGLKLLQRGPANAKRIPGVEYGGPHANHVLRIVAEHAVAAPQ